MGPHRRHLLPRQVLGREKRRELATGAVGKPLEQGRGVRDPGAGEEQGGPVEVARLVGEQQQVPRRQVVGHDQPAAVEEAPTRRRQRNPPQAVVLRERPPVNALEYLQVDQAQAEQAQGDDGGDHEDAGTPAEGRELLSDLHHRSRRDW